MSPAIDFAKASSRDEILAAASRIVQDVANEAEDGFALRPGERIESPADIERCIAKLRTWVDESPLLDCVEDRAYRLLGYLMVASIRARQLN